MRTGACPVQTRRDTPFSADYARVPQLGRMISVPGAVTAYRRSPLTDHHPQIADFCAYPQADKQAILRIRNPVRSGAPHPGSVAPRVAADLHPETKAPQTNARPPLPSPTRIRARTPLTTVVPRVPHRATPMPRGQTRPRGPCTRGRCGDSVVRPSAAWYPPLPWRLALVPTS